MSPNLDWYQFFLFRPTSLEKNYTAQIEEEKYL